MGKYINLIQKINEEQYDEVYIKQNLPREFLFNLLAENWTGTGPYTQTVTVNGITANTSGIIGVAMTATDSQWQASQYAQLRITEQGANYVSVVAYGARPSVDIPCVITCSNNMKLLRSNGSTTTDTVVG